MTILEFGGGVFEVKATSGDTHLGGTDMDERVFDHLADRLRADTGIDVRGDPKATARLREAAELAKVELSTSVTTHVSLWRTEILGVPDAVLGTRRLVPTLDGEVPLTIPPGSQPGTVLRVAGRGLPRADRPGRGDLVVTVAVHVPDHPTDEERRLHEQLAALAHGG